MAPYRLIVDHLDGYRRGQRDMVAIDGQLRFGRHPDSDVVFHASRDIDASAHHAALRVEQDEFLLVDLGSSNGTFVDGDNVDRKRLDVGTPVEVVFGEGGPRCRVLILGDGDEEPELPGGHTGNATAVRSAIALAVRSSGTRSVLLLGAGLLLITAAIVLALR